ncbi:hypothetical protein EDB83DRAFT_2532639 [Lactarius deliciosus]|nr:hypothetical protein EDB83DRAFT_2532639 [Lactarius deliciosus]
MSAGEPEEDGDVGEATGGDEDWTADWEELDNMLDNEEVDGTVTFQPDLVFTSPSSYFQTVCAEEGVKPLELKKWARTHWGSMYDLLERPLSSKLAVNKFVLVADDSDRVPKLKNKSYFDYRITPDEWKLLELMQEVLQEPREVQASFSSEKMPMVWHTIPTLECLQERWEIMARNANKTDTYLYVLVTLDPTIKLEYCRANWDEGCVTAGAEALERIFDSYYQPLQLSAPTEPVPLPPNGSPQKSGYAASWMRAAVQSRLRTEAVSHNPHKEFKDYLRENEVRAATAVLERLLGAWEYETDHVQTARAVSSYTPHPSTRYQEPWE